MCRRVRLSHDQPPPSFLSFCNRSAASGHFRAHTDPADRVRTPRGNTGNAFERTVPKGTDGSHLTQATQSLNTHYLTGKTSASAFVRSDRNLIKWLESL